MKLSKGPYLVTGATGFVGSAVARALSARGADVRVLARPGSDRRNLDGIDVTVYEGDLLKPETLTAALSGCEGVFHVAADYRLWTRDPDAMFRANVDGSRALLAAAQDAGVKRAVYTSSVAVLGIDPAGRPADEDTPVTYADMIGVYKQSKYRAEVAVNEVIRDTGLDCVIVNPSTPIGPRDVKPTPTGRLVLEAAGGRMPAYVDTGLNVAHVDDVAAGHLLAYEKGKTGRRYILGGEDMTLKDILYAVAGFADVKPPLMQIPRAPIYPIAWMAERWCAMTGKGEPFATVDGLKMSKKKMFFSSKRAESELGYTHRPGRDALRDAVGWFRENGYLTGS
ncbi:MAG: NAD-dependent epimerase/dehydratase family protein [Rhodospirillales bacterium]|nr:NAD-dependent epimerase/dehydratase family protein [Rhodospirillales bacterium]MBO6788809.1 NAD-dependent epimerase/dehydratase family protein [Rhodospirillales bacterium]